MGFIGNIISGVAQDVGHAVEGVGEGVEKTMDGAGKLAQGALSLDPKEMFSGAKDVVSGGIKTASNAAELSPEGLEASAANHLMDGALDACGMGGAQGSSAGDAGGNTLDALKGATKAANLLADLPKMGSLAV